eukprot:1426420-Pyramimonas_sp.AAC.1
MWKAATGGAAPTLLESEMAIEWAQCSVHSQKRFTEKGTSQALRRRRLAIEPAMLPHLATLHPSARGPVRNPEVMFDRGPKRIRLSTPNHWTVHDETEHHKHEDESHLELNWKRARTIAPQRRSLLQEEQVIGRQKMF